MSDCVYIVPIPDAVMLERMWIASR
jgi:hypothetical protein